MQQPYGCTQWHRQQIPCLLLHRHWQAGVWVGGRRDTLPPAGTADTQSTKDSVPDDFIVELAVLMDIRALGALSAGSDISKNTGWSAWSSIARDTDPSGEDIPTLPLSPAPVLSWMTGGIGTAKSKQYTGCTWGDDSMARRAAPAVDVTQWLRLLLWLVDFPLSLLHDLVNVLPCSLPFAPPARCLLLRQSHPCHSWPSSSRLM